MVDREIYVKSSALSYRENIFASMFSLATTNACERNCLAFLEHQPTPTSSLLQ